jgi:hypothetical protein
VFSDLFIQCYWQLSFPKHLLKEVDVFIVTGLRSVQLKNDYNDYLELASLLVHITLVNPKVSGAGNSHFNMLFA